MDLRMCIYRLYNKIIINIIWNALILKSRQHVLLKKWYVYTKLHGITSQKTKAYTTVRNKNITNASIKCDFHIVHMWNVSE